jgi:hypothetical protein
VISLPVLESPHSGGRGEELLSLCNSVQCSAAVHMCADSVHNKKNQLNLYILHLSHTRFQLHLAMFHVFAAMVKWLCYFTPDDTDGGCDIGTVSSLKDVCVCTRALVCGWAVGVVGGRGWWRWWK